jgi:S-adenosylmethionine:tRNA ribosyltransferase-isomerase
VTIAMASAGLEFVLPPELEAHEPPEARGLRRDQVRLLVSHLDDARVEHLRFSDLPDVLKRGDLLVANDSRTLPAAVTARRADGDAVVLHFSGGVPEAHGSTWVVEPRRAALTPGETLRLPGGASVTLVAPYRESARLWVATIKLPDSLKTYLARHGRPITYSYLRGQWPIDMYQTVYAAEAGSAEMPSAGRAFSPDVLERLAHRGIGFVTLTLHTGVASLEKDERPYPEPYRVPPATAEAVCTARHEGRRVIAVGTTVVRALETAAEAGGGQVEARQGWTDLVITPERRLQAVDALLTGFHEPKATHLAMLEAIASRRHLEVAYQAALAHGYRWHEFGDLHLIV